MPSDPAIGDDDAVNVMQFAAVVEGVQKRSSVTVENLASIRRYVHEEQCDELSLLCHAQSILPALLPYPSLLSQLPSALPTAVFLVVDDNAINRKFLSWLLSIAFAGVVAFFSYALEVLQTVEVAIRRFNKLILLTDIHMPDMGGIELSRRLRRNFDTATLSIIGVTADHTGQVMEECMRCGMQAVLHKPVLYSHLMETVSGLLPPATPSTD
jgi:CheY-like chemotaxis protein